MRRDRSPLRFLPWVARDAFVWPLRVFLVAVVVITVLVFRFHAQMHLPGAGGRRASMFGAGITNIAEMLQAQVWATCLTVAILMTIGGIVGTDLERGYYRSYFSKPMSPLWYYLQRWLIGALVIGVSPILLGLGLALALDGSTGLSWTLMGQIGLAYLLIGSATLLTSIFTSRGWLVVFILAIVQGILAGLATGQLLPGWFLLIHHILPPFQLTGVRTVLASGGDLWHVIGYSLGMFALAVILLRKRPLGSGITS